MLVLAYLDGMSQSEIAAAKNQPLGTVKTRTRTGLRRLSESLRSRHKQQTTKTKTDNENFRN